MAQILEAIIGSPPTPGSEAEWVEFVDWRDPGLSVGFDTPAALDYDGVSRFVGWGYAAPAGLGLVTDEGVGIGSSLAEVRAAYGDRLRFFTELDECVGAWTYQLTSRSGEVEITGTLDRQPADDALIASAHADIDLGC